jgi:hypothetical protein
MSHTRPPTGFLFGSHGKSGGIPAEPLPAPGDEPRQRSRLRKTLILPICGGVRKKLTRMAAATLLGDPRHSERNPLTAERSEESGRHRHSTKGSSLRSAVTACQGLLPRPPEWVKFPDFSAPAVYHAAFRACCIHQSVHQLPARLSLRFLRTLWARWLPAQMKGIAFFVEGRGDTLSSDARPHDEKGGVRERKRCRLSRTVCVL